MSSHLKAVAYDRELREMTIEFKNESEYTYLDVSPTEVRSLMSARSKGKNFWRYIRDEKTTILDKKGHKKK
jgi:hypothetical protein